MGLSQAKRIIVTGAGGGPALNFVKSLRLAPEPFYLIGVDCDKYHLAAAQTDERHLVPRASHEDYIPVMQDLIAESEAQFLEVVEEDLGSSIGEGDRLGQPDWDSRSVTLTTADLAAFIRQRRQYSQVAGP